MGGQINTSNEVATAVADALNMYKEAYPLLGEEVEEIQSAASVPRIRLKLNNGETFVIDITREPKPRRQ